jgi:cyclophilin family peptidyl-prolyl cis-trans isomerase
MPDKDTSAVSRWHESLDIQKFREAEAKRRKHLALAWSAVLVVSLGLVGAALLSGGKPEPPAQNPEEAEKAAIASAVADTMPKDPEVIKKLLSNPTNPVIRIDTGKGAMLVELYEDKVPNTVANMIELAESGFYKGMSFHRIIRGFMAQGGCPFSKRGALGRPGTGDPGYKFADEFDPTLHNDARGLISMANAGPNTNGSQFFLLFSPQSHLDGKHAVFGKVIAGMNTLAALERIGSTDNSGEPLETVRFDISVVLKQNHEYHVKKL